MKWKVALTRDATESTSVEVEAETREEANSKALEMAGAYGDDLDTWTLDEGNMHRAYLPDPDSTEPVGDGVGETIEFGSATDKKFIGRQYELQGVTMRIPRAGPPDPLDPRNDPNWKDMDSETRDAMMDDYRRLKEADLEDDIEEEKPRTEIHNWRGPTDEPELG